MCFIYLIKRIPMPRRKATFDKSEISNLPLLKEQLCLKVLLQRVEKDGTFKKERSLEQKIIALKILILNMMQWTLTARQCNVDRKTLYSWWKQYGELITQSKPEQQIAEAIENDLAILMRDVYTSARKTIKKLDSLVDKADTVRQMYPVSEALRVLIEIIKMDIELNKSKKIKGNEFNMGIFNQMITNQYGNTD